MISSNTKYFISKRIDALIDRRINKEFHRRFHNDEHRSNRLRNILEYQEEYQGIDKRITEQDLKNQVHELFNENLIDFLKSEDIIPKLSNTNIKYAFRTITESYRDGYTGTHLYLIMYKFYKGWQTWLREKMWCIEPIIEVKIQDITEFITEKENSLPLLEAAKTVRKKTLEEKIHRDANGEIVFEEIDMYNLIRYFGTSIGRGLQGLERYIRTDFSLDEVRLYEF
jgi:hypothetical protein